jgi:hypothetical protein
MGAKSILDTDILSEYLKGHDPVVVAHAARYAKEFKSESTGTRQLPRSRTELPDCLRG